MLFFILLILMLFVILRFESFSCKLIKVLIIFRVVKKFGIIVIILFLVLLLVKLELLKK